MKHNKKVVKTIMKVECHECGNIGIVKGGKDTRDNIICSKCGLINYYQILELNSQT